MIDELMSIHICTVLANIAMLQFQELFLIATMDDDIN